MDHNCFVDLAKVNGVPEAEVKEALNSVCVALQMVMMKVWVLSGMERSVVVAVSAHFVFVLSQLCGAHAPSASPFQSLCILIMYFSAGCKHTARWR